MKANNISSHNHIFKDDEIESPLFDVTKYEEEKLCLLEYLYRQNKDYLDDKVISFNHKEYSYGEFFQIVLEQSRHLSSMGLKEGDTFLLCGNNTIESFALILAASRLSLTVMLVDPSTDVDYVKAIALEKNIKVFFVIEQYAIKFRYLFYYLDQVIELPSAIYIASETYSHLIGRVYQFRGKVIAYRTWIQKKIEVSLINEVTLSHPLVILLSKRNHALVFSNEAFIAACKMMKDGFSFSRGKKIFHNVPLHSSIGLSSLFFASLAMGLEVVLAFPYLSINNIKKEIIDNKVEILFLPLSQWLALSNLKEEDFSFLESIYSYTSAMNQNEYEAITSYLNKSKCQLNIKTLYHKDACLGFLTKGSETGFSSSKILPYVKIKICDIKTKRELSYQEKGRILLSCPSLLDCYYNDDINKTRFYKDDDNEIYFDSFDIGLVDIKDELHIYSKADECLDREDLYYYDLEKSILANSKIKQVKVIKREVGNRTTLVAFIVLKDNIKENPYVLLNEINDMFIGYNIDARPNYYKILKEIPYGMNCKVDYKKLNRCHGLYKVCFYNKE